MQNYRIQLVGEHELPEGVGWAIARTNDGGMVAFLKRSAMLNPDELQEAWAAAFELQASPWIPRVPAIVRQLRPAPPLAATG